METKILEELGLTKNEIQIFITLVKRGILSATQVATYTGLNRPYVYYALDRLLEKGYISQIKVKGKKNFQAVKFEQLISLEEHKVEIFKKFIQDLEKQRGRTKEEISVEVFKGRFVVKNIFKRCISEIKPNQEMLYIGIDEEKMESIEPIYLKKVLNYFVEKNIKERVIIKKGGKRLLYAKNTKYKHLDKNLIGNTAKIIYQNTVIELIYSDPIYAIVIDNKNLAQTEKKQFEVFWKLAKK